MSAVRSRARRRSFRSILIVLSLSLLLAASMPASAQTPARDSFRIAWSIYVGWMPWGFGADSGIVARWAERYGINIEVVQINDYIESINLYTAGAFDGVTATNMDALTIPAAGGVDTTALIVGDFSDGNDGLVLKNGTGIEDVKGRRVHLVELSVSHYLLARALDSVGLSERDITVVNTSDADIVGAFGSRDVTAVVTWNPQLGEIRARSDASVVFDSSQIPGEIMDLLLINTQTLQANPALGKALAGAWYEILDTMRADDEAGRAARAAMGEAGGTDLAGYEAQLASTRMFYDASEAVAFVTGPEPRETMEYVRQFAFEHGLLGEHAPSPDFVGIEFADGTILGNPDNVRFRFTAEYMQLAADGQL